MSLVWQSKHYSITVLLSLCGFYARAYGFFDGRFVVWRSSIGDCGNYYVVEAVALNCLLTGWWKLWIEAFAPSFLFVVRHAYIDISVACAERRRPVAVSPFRSFLCSKGFAVGFHRVCLSGGVFCIACWGIFARNRTRCFLWSDFV